MQDAILHTIFFPLLPWRWSLYFLFHSNVIGWVGLCFLSSGRLYLPLRCFVFALVGQMLFLFLALLSVPVFLVRLLFLRFYFCTGIVFLRLVWLLLCSTFRLLVFFRSGRRAPVLRWCRHRFVLLWQILCLRQRCNICFLCRNMLLIFLKGWSRLSYCPVLIVSVRVRRKGWCQVLCSWNR